MRNFIAEFEIIGNCSITDNNKIENIENKLRSEIEGKEYEAANIEDIVETLAKYAGFNNVRCENLYFMSEYLIGWYCVFKFVFDDINGYLYVSI